MALSDIKSWKIGSLNVESVTYNGIKLWSAQSKFDGYLFGGDHSVKSFNRDGTAAYWVSNTGNNAPYASFTGDARHKLIYKPAGSANAYTTAEGHVNAISSDTIYLANYTTFDNDGYLYSPSVFLSRSIDMTHIDYINMRYSSTNIKTMDYGSMVALLKMTGSSDPSELSNSQSFNVWNQRYDIPRAAGFTNYAMDTRSLTGQWYIAISSYSWDSTLEDKNIQISDIWITPQSGYDVFGEETT